MHGHADRNNLLLHGHSNYMYGQWPMTVSNFEDCSLEGGHIAAYPQFLAFLQSFQLMERALLQSPVGFVTFLLEKRAFAVASTWGLSLENSKVNSIPNICWVCKYILYTEVEVYTWIYTPSAAGTSMYKPRIDCTEV